MSLTRQRRRLDFLGILLALLAFQVAGLIRYAKRLPGDWIGLSLYVATIVLVILAGFVVLGRLASD